MLEFVTRFPDMRVDLLFSGRVTNIVCDRIDVFVRVSAPVDSALIAHRLVPDRRVICSSPEYLREHGQSSESEDLGTHNVLIYSTVYSDN